MVLGQFKKQHKRRDPNLRPWEEGGHRMQVLAVGSQGDMLAHQAAARGLALPTHTYATLSKEQGRGQRSVMAIGPAPAELLDQVCGCGVAERLKPIGWGKVWQAWQRLGEPCGLDLATCKHCLLCSRQPLCACCPCCTTRTGRRGQTH